MRLFIVRHGIAIDRDDPACPAEAERFLTDEGTEKTRRVARRMRAIGLEARQWYTSPYERARQTATIFADALGTAKISLTETASLLPDADPAAFIRELRRDKSQTAVAFGHAPHLDVFIAALCGAGSPITDLKKAGVACVDIVSFTPLVARLVWLVAPKLLNLTEK
ncbi:MAG: phosphohistidine phosphatase SixA [Deltaproteobacteria bacterium]|nr:phosphohistidine phosphatase SixA [Deltaproteobacteria bacterium]